MVTAVVLAAGERPTPMMSRHMQCCGCRASHAAAHGNLPLVINLIKQNSHKSITAWLINKSLINYCLQNAPTRVGISGLPPNSKIKDECYRDSGDPKAMHYLKLQQS